MLFDEITASNLVKIDLSGNKVMESAYDINPAGFVIHSAIHEAREDAQCIVHLHTTNGVAVAAQKDGILPISQQSIVVLASLAYHDYEGLSLRADEKPRLVKDLGDKKFLMLRNHGLLTVADTIPDAFVYMYIFERCCAIQLGALTGNRELIEISRQIIDGAMKQFREVTKEAGGTYAWPALLRKLDRIDSSFRN